MPLDEFALEIYIGLVVLCYVVGTLQLYGYIRFRSMRHLVIVAKRYPSLVLMEAIACMVNLFVATPIGPIGRHTPNNIILTPNICSVALLANNRFGVFTIDNRLFESVVEYSDSVLSMYPSYFIIVIEAYRIWFILYIPFCCETYCHRLQAHLLRSALPPRL